MFDELALSDLHQLLFDRQYMALQVNVHIDLKRYDN